MYSITQMKNTLCLLLVWFSGYCGQSDVSYCAFCDPAVLTSHVFYEEDLTLALCTHKPITEGHCLIIPKRHVERFEMLSDEECLQICRVIKKVNEAAIKAFGASSYLLLQKNGTEAGQTVPHVHFHYIPRKQGDDSIVKFFFKSWIRNMKKPIDGAELKENIEIMKNAFRDY